ncbi:MAG: hypothetical protein KIT62_02735 [Cyclobacteriaceae bacterium]|nr:hypothetical protein [Cyclobacteriaceae bacterium]
MKHRLVFVVLIALAPGFLCAQATQTARYEREQKNSDNDYILISLQKEGLALVRDKDKYKEGKKQWEIIRVDTTLQEVWLLEMEIENRLRLVGYDYRDNQIYLLYREGDHEASSLVLFTIHTQSQAIGRYSIKQEMSFKVTHFSALANVVTLGGYVSSEPAILLYDLQTEKAKLVPGFFVTNSELLDLRVNTNNTFNVLLIDRSNKQSKKLLLKTFDATGASLLEDEIEIESERTILSGITSTLINDELLVAGTWTEGNSKQASGIFTTLINPFANQPVNYYDFGRFNHFLDYLSDKRAGKIKSKSADAARTGVIPDFKTYAVPMRLDEQPEGFGLLVEVYQPANNFSPYPYYGNFGPPMYAYSPYGYNPFMNRYYNAPYQYNQPVSGYSKMIYSALTVLDLNGKPVRDFGLKLGDLKTNSLEQTSDFTFYKGEIAMAFKKEKEVRILRSLTDEIEMDTLTSQLKNPNESVRNESEASYIRNWYNNVFYVWGYHTLRDSRKGALESGRQIFYINKIEVK